MEQFNCERCNKAFASYANMTRHLSRCESAPSSFPIAIGMPNDTKNCIAIGNEAYTKQKDYSVVIAGGKSTYISEDSNINFAHVMEADSDTKKVIFPGEVTVPSITSNEFYVGDSLSMQKIDECDACLEEGVGFSFDAGGHIGRICMLCIRRSAMAFTAKERWAENNGDPMADVLKRLAALEKKDQ